MRFLKNRILLLLVSLILFALLNKINYAQSTKSPENWRKIDLPVLSFYAPSDFDSEPFKGKDSIIWKQRNQNLKLTIDFGLYSAKPIEDREEDDYLEKTVFIDKKKATFVTFKFANSETKEFKYIAALYFSRIDTQNNKLALVASCKSPKDQQIAKKIFLSIDLKNMRK